MYDVTMSLRMVEELYQKLKKIAEEEKRSINAEINYIIEKYIKEIEKQKKED